MNIVDGVRLDANTAATGEVIKVKFVWSRLVK
jgi:hypothetical protein